MSGRQSQLFAMIDSIVPQTRALAESAFPGEDPIGRRMLCCEGSPDDPRWKTVVGVAGDVVQLLPRDHRAEPGVGRPAALQRGDIVGQMAFGGPDEFHGGLRSAATQDPASGRVARPLVHL